MLDDRDQVVWQEGEPEEAFVPIYDQDPPRWMTEKVIARLKHIEASELPADWKRQQIELTIRNAETWDSITNGGTYTPGTSRTQSGRAPEWPLYPEPMDNVKDW